MPSYQPKIKWSKRVYPCRVCKKVRDPKQMFIDGIDGNNYAITQNAVKNPICSDCRK